MIYAEAAYFDGAHFAHIAAYEHARSLDRRRRLAREHAERNRKCFGFRERAIFAPSPLRVAGGRENT